MRSSAFVASAMAAGALALPHWGDRVQARNSRIVTETAIEIVTVFVTVTTGEGTQPTGIALPISRQASLSISTPDARPTSKTVNRSASTPTFSSPNAWPTSKTVNRSSPTPSFSSPNAWPTSKTVNRSSPTPSFSSPNAWPTSKTVIRSSLAAAPTTSKGAPTSSKAVPTSSKAVSTSSRAAPTSSKAVSTSAQVAPISNVAPTSSTKATPSSVRATPSSIKASSSSIRAPSVAPVIPSSSTRASSSSAMTPSAAPVATSSSTRAPSAAPVAPSSSTRPTPTPSPAPVPTTSSTYVAPPAASSSAAPQSGGSSGTHISGTSQAFLSSGAEYQAAVLYHHNAARANHNAAPLTWNTDCEANARIAAERCTFEHYIPAGANQGQNLFTVSGTAFNVTAGITESWYKSELPPMLPYFGQSDVPDDVFHSVGHLTQLLWKSTTGVGCVSIDCGANMIVNGMTSSLNKYTVCNYAPPGNVGGQYGINVAAPISTTNLGSWSD